MDYSHDGYHYIASPYTHADPVIRQRRFEKALDFTAWLAIKYRMWGYSPIVHSHPMVLHHDMPVPMEFWVPWDHAMIHSAVSVIVLQIPGWEVSKGIYSELEYASELGKPVYMSQVLWGSLYDHSI